MKKKGYRNFKYVCFLVSGSVFFSYSCGEVTPTSTAPGTASTTTGQTYKYAKKSSDVDESTGFTLHDFKGQPSGPNLVFIEGGRVVLGSYEEDLMNRRDNIERTVTVASFYMDETEVANIHWLEYLYDLQQKGEADKYQKALPDTTVWYRVLAFNDPYIDHYFRYPGFRFYPVVGVSWSQAVDFCVWRTNFVNTDLAKKAGLLDEGAEGSTGEATEQRIPLETGVVLPNYRLPTEAEWEYAAQGLIGVQWLDENQTHKRIYPWDGNSQRNPYGKRQGYFLANFKRGRGDYAGIAGKLNDGAMITTSIYDYPQNDNGLWNMAGNVNEWVYDVYRPLSFQDFEDLNPVRRDDFLDEDKGYDTQNTLISGTVRVYKGGSWKDVTYWLSPGTRRYLEQDSSTATIGFRCAMIRAGSNY